jgi:hypothetical protein
MLQIDRWDTGDGQISEGALQSPITLLGCGVSVTRHALEWHRGKTFLGDRPPTDDVMPIPNVPPKPYATPWRGSIAKCAKRPILGR